MEGWWECGTGGKGAGRTAGEDGSVCEGECEPLPGYPVGREPGARLSSLPASVLQVGKQDPQSASL